MSQYKHHNINRKISLKLEYNKHNTLSHLYIFVFNEQTIGVSKKNLLIFKSSQNIKY